MNYQTQQLQNAIIATISEIFGGNFSDICNVKQSVLHLEAVYFCHSTCSLLNNDNLSLKEQLALYRNSQLLPQSTIAFFETNQDYITKHWPEKSVFSEKPEILYEALLSNELNISPSKISFKTDKVSRDVAGAYYTSLNFAAQITRRAIDTFIEEKTGITQYSFSANKQKRQVVINALSKVSFLDYACGCGDFLIAVLQYFEQYVENYPIELLVCQLKGVDVDPIALMIAIARILNRAKQTSKLSVASTQFIVGNPLLHTEQIASLDQRFSYFALNRLYAVNEGINCYGLAQGVTLILGNPPWEKLRFEERAFFRPLRAEISEISQKNKRAEKIAELDVEWPELLNYYELVQSDYVSLKKSIPKHPFLKMSLVGELNTYALFAELASRLIAKDGFSAIIVKSALVTSTCYSSCFRHFVTNGLLSDVFLYDNREKIFPIDSREKFCVLFFKKSKECNLKVYYGLTKPDEILKAKPLHVDYQELELINPETGLLPNITDAREFSFLLRAYRSLPVFSTEFPNCHFGRLVHLTAHASYISTESTENNVPIYEGKFIWQYDNRFSTFAGMTESERYQAKASAKRQLGDGFLMQKSIPESRYFVTREFWETFLTRYDQPYSLCWRSLTSPTNQRTMIASIIPSMPTCQSIQLLQSPSPKDLLLMLALFNSKVFDHFVRLKMAGIDLTQSIIRQIPVPSMNAWEQCVCIGGVSYRASDAVMALEKLLYRNESSLDNLWEGVKDIEDAEMHYLSAADLREEIDKIIIRLYGLSDVEEQMVRASFTI